MELNEYVPDDTVEYQIGFCKGMGLAIELMIKSLGINKSELEYDYPEIHETLEQVKDNLETYELQIKQKYEAMAGKRRFFVDLDLEDMKDKFVSLGEHDRLVDNPQQQAFIELVDYLFDPETSLEIVAHLMEVAETDVEEMDLA